MAEQPTGHQGPFIEPSRGSALRRMLASRGTGGAPTGPAGPPRRPPERPSWMRSLVAYLWRVFRWRLVLTVLGLLVLGIGLLTDGGEHDASTVVPRMIDRLGDLGSTSSSTSSSTTSTISTGTSTTTFTAPDVEVAAGDGAPDSTVPAGSDLVAVQRMSGRRVVVEDMLGRTYTWIVPTQAHRQVLRAEVGRFVLVSWTRERAGVTVTAVRPSGQPADRG